MRLIVAPIFLMLAPVPATACLPPIPGAIEPPALTIEQRAEAIASSSKNIVFGVVVRGTADGRPGTLRIAHVYKGDLRAGTQVGINDSWGFDPPMCAGMLGSPPPTPKGAYGVFAWSGDPELNRVSEDLLAVMFERKLIVSAKGR